MDQYLQSTEFFDYQHPAVAALTDSIVAGLSDPLQNDSIFQPFNNHGEKHVEYMADHGNFADVPREFIVDYVARAYPHLVGKEGQWKELTLQRFTCAGLKSD